MSSSSSPTRPVADLRYPSRMSAPPDFPPGLILVHGNRAEALRDVLVAWVKHHPLAPLEDETVLVQSNGIAQWLRLAMADEREGGCGIAAAMRFDLPSRFFWRVYRAVLGRDAVPEASPLDESRLVWRLMRLLPELLREPVYAPLARFLADDHDARKRFQLAGRLADLFDQYQVYRADWLASWRAGEDVLPDPDGRATPLPEDQLWQPALWRALCRDLEAAGLSAGGGRAAVHERFMEAVEAAGDGRPPGVPRRVLVFGISSLPRQSLEVLAAIARWSQVLMCVHNPCEYHWADIVEGRELLRRERASRQARRADFPAELSEDALHLHAQPLLAAWGRQGRDFIALLDSYDDAAARGRHEALLKGLGHKIDAFVRDEKPAHLLAQLQDDIRDLRPLAETRDKWPAVAPDDHSIQFHVAHSPQREVEILHDRLLAAFDADPTLRPRDVIVMVPDIDAYAPHVRAVFGLHEPGDPRYIPYCLADQGRRATDPLVGGLERLLGLPNARVTASEVLDLLDVPALRRRFGIDEADLPVLARWIRDANVRWGLHAEHRAALGLPPPDGPDHGWLFGLRRLLLGYAAGRDVAWQGIEAHGDVGGLDAALLGPLAQLVARLDAAWRALREPAPPAVWRERLSGLLEHFFDAGDDAESALTLERLRKALADWDTACAEAGLDEPLPLAVVAEHWMSALDAGGLTQRFFAGGVTFATLMPMRAIPFRHVCLLGMNDGDYPRTRAPLDFDLMGRPGQMRPGDRSRREDDRYLFLEALLSARDVLYVSWVGRSITDNARRPPSVLVGQLRDHLAAGWRAAADGDLLERLTVEHRLQPFSPAYFGGNEALFTYAREWRADAVPASAPAPLPPVEREMPLTLDELRGFVTRPVECFFRDRLGVRLTLAEDEAGDVEPFAPDALEDWARGRELIVPQLRALLAGADVAAARAQTLERLARRGDLAPGAFGRFEAHELDAVMTGLFDECARLFAEWPQALDEVQVTFETAVDGRVLRLSDTLGGLRAGDGDRLRVVVEASAVERGKDRFRERRDHVVLRHWPAHLAAQLGGPTATRLVSPDGGAVLPPLEADVARGYLADWLAAWDEGMRAPLPLAVRTAFAWLKAKPERREEEARKAYEGDDRRPGERDRDAHLARAWPDFDALRAGGFADCVQRLLEPMRAALDGLKGDGE